MHLRSSPLIAILMSISLSACSHTSPTNQLLSNKTQSAWQVENSKISQDKNDFIEEVSHRYQIPPSYIAMMLEKAKLNTRVISLIRSQKPQNIKRHWASYRQRFVDTTRIKKGNRFWSAHRQELKTAEQRYGVPAAIIVSIIGVETVYGEQLGSFNLLDTLYTLGFHHPDQNRPEKSQMFRNQLAALIELSHQGKLAGDQMTGSFAGAFGLGQFMPLSILHYGVDADQDGKVDLKNSSKDAIFSVANFLVQHGWQKNMPVFAPVSLPPSAPQLVDGGLEPTQSWAFLKNQHASTSVHQAPWQKGTVLGVIDLRDDINGKHEYRTATQNFFTFTKYNRSYFYAAAVADLATALAKEQQKQGNSVNLP